jgi:hypothetical protein
LGRTPDFGCDLAIRPAVYCAEPEESTVGVRQVCNRFEHGFWKRKPFLDRFEGWVGLEVARKAQVRPSPIVHAFPAERLTQDVAGDPKQPGQR